MKQRWYDKDPTVSLAISLLKNSNDDAKQRCSVRIIEIAKHYNITVSKSFFQKLNYALKRWYDEEKYISEAMEYLRLSQSDLRKIIALEIIEILEQSESK